MSEIETQPAKRKRNLPGKPDPEAEVIALSPRTLLTTNRFVCDICNKGFQRDQNLQLHRRGHNLPWKLKQKTSNEIKKRVYVCPVTTCVHHDHSRALGDLTGIKKHFCRKHGQKRFKCDKCCKMYAVLSDLKAHIKNCGTKEYKCDCGIMFSRRDSFVTHRAFCEALAQESSIAHAPTMQKAGANIGHSLPHPQPLNPPTTTVVSPVLSVQSSELPENSTPSDSTQAASKVSSSSPSSAVFASIYASSSSTRTVAQAPKTTSPFSNLATVSTQQTVPTIESTSLSLSASLYDISPNSGFSLFPTQSTMETQPAMSATALLQKAAQMGASASHGSLLKGSGLTTSGQQHNSSNRTPKWGLHVKAEADAATSGLGLGLTSALSSSLTNVMTSRSSVLENKPATLDLLGLGIGAAGENSTGGLSSLVGSFRGAGFNVPPGEAWKGELEK